MSQDHERLDIVAVTFVDGYYKKLVQGKVEELTSWYRPESVFSVSDLSIDMSVRALTIHGVDQIVSELGKRAKELSGCQVHLLQVEPQPTDDYVLVTVWGFIMSSNSARYFLHTFLLSDEGSDYCICNDVLRFVPLEGKPHFTSVVEHEATQDAALPPKELSPAEEINVAEAAIPQEKKEAMQPVEREDVGKEEQPTENESNKHVEEEVPVSSVPHPSEKPKAPWSNIVRQSPKPVAKPHAVQRVSPPPQEKPPQQQPDPKEKKTKVKAKALCTRILKLTRAVTDDEINDALAPLKEHVLEFRNRSNDLLIVFVDFATADAQERLMMHPPQFSNCRVTVEAPRPKQQ